MIGRGTMDKDLLLKFAPDQIEIMRSIWSGMKWRCANTPRYYKKNIILCERWLNHKTGFRNFMFDMGARPSNSHSIDRVDNDGNYEPGNCRWATRSQQALNKGQTCKMLQDEELVDFVIANIHGKHKRPK